MQQVVLMADAAMLGDVRHRMKSSKLVGAARIVRIGVDAFLAQHLTQRNTRAFVFDDQQISLLHLFLMEA